MQELERIRELVHEIAGVPGEQVTPESTVDSLNLDYRSSIRFRMAVEDDAEHVGGLTIFGKTFGNYGQDIKVSIHYAPMEEAPQNESSN